MKGFLVGVCISAVIVAAVFFFLRKDTNSDIEFDPIVVIRDTIRIEKEINVYVESKSSATIPIINGIGTHVFRDSIPFFFSDTTKVGTIESRGFISISDSILLSVRADSSDVDVLSGINMFANIRRSMRAGIHQDITVIAKPEIPVSLRDLLSGREGQELIGEYIRAHDEEAQKKPNIFIGCSASVPFGIGPGVSVTLGRWCMTGSATATQQGSCTFIGVGYRVW